MAKAGVWYLVARKDNGEMRVFRADRIIAVDVSGGTFERPADFKLEEFWETWSARFMASLPRYVVRVRVAPEVIEDIAGYWEVQLIDDAQTSDGWAHARVIFPSLSAAVPQLIAWGRRVEIIEPEEARASVIARAREILAAATL